MFDPYGDGDDSVEPDVEKPAGEEPPPGWEDIDEQEEEKPKKLTGHQRRTLAGRRDAPKGVAARKAAKKAADKAKKKAAARGVKIASKILKRGVKAVKPAKGKKKAPPKQPPRPPRKPILRRDKLKQRDPLWHGPGVRTSYVSPGTGYGTTRLGAPPGGGESEDMGR